MFLYREGLGRILTNFLGVFYEAPSPCQPSTREAQLETGLPVTKEET